MRILDLIDLVSNELRENLSSIDFWNRLVYSYFSSTSVMRFTTTGATVNQPMTGLLEGFAHGLEPYLYELNAATAPRFLLAVVLAQNVATHQVTLPGIKFQVMNNGSLFIVSRLQALITYLDGSVGNLQGTCRILLSRDFRIEWLDCRCLNYQSSLTMRALETHWASFDNTLGGNFVESLSKNSESVRAASNSGIHPNAMRVMQLGSLMSYLKPLMLFAAANNHASPLLALEKYIALGANSRNGNGAVSSPSPRTVAADEPKAPKKRRTSSSLESPMVSGSKS